MLGYLFGFNARLGRLRYFLASIGLGVVLTVLSFGIASHVVQNARLGIAPSMSQLGWPLLAVIALFLFGTFTLNCMRIRDIGWDPVVVAVGWIAFTILDKVIAGKFPLWSIGGTQQSTVVGAFVNLGLTLILLFWPSGYAEEPPPLPRDAGGSEGTWRRSSAPSAATSRLARVSNGEFGGRGR